MMYKTVDQIIHKTPLQIRDEHIDKTIEKDKLTPHEIRGLITLVYEGLLHLEGYLPPPLLIERRNGTNINKIEEEIKNILNNYTDDSEKAKLITNYIILNTII